MNWPHLVPVGWPHKAWMLGSWSPAEGVGGVPPIQCNCHMQRGHPCEFTYANLILSGDLYYLSPLLGSLCLS